VPFRPCRHFIERVEVLPQLRAGLPGSQTFLRPFVHVFHAVATSQIREGTVAELPAEGSDLRLQVDVFHVNFTSRPGKA
jgi:hypothetical protein